MTLASCAAVAGYGKSTRQALLWTASCMLQWGLRAQATVFIPWSMNQELLPDHPIEIGRGPFGTRPVVILLQRRAISRFWSSYLASTCSDRALYTTITHGEGNFLTRIFFSWQSFIPALGTSAIITSFILSFYITSWSTELYFLGSVVKWSADCT